MDEETRGANIEGASAEGGIPLLRVIKLGQEVFRLVRRHGDASVRNAKLPVQFIGHHHSSLLEGMIMGSENNGPTMQLLQLGWHCTGHHNGSLAYERPLVRGADKGSSLGHGSRGEGGDSNLGVGEVREGEAIVDGSRREGEVRLDVAFPAEQSVAMPSKVTAAKVVEAPGWIMAVGNFMIGG
jgi:hypothetical protein